MYFGNILDGVTHHLLHTSDIKIFNNQNPSDLEMLDHHLQAAIVDLCTRFNLRARRAYIKLQSGITEYTLSPINGYAASGAVNPYILDSTGHLMANEPFIDDVLLIESVYKYDSATKTTGSEIPFNKPVDTLSVLSKGIVHIVVPSIYLDGSVDALELRYRSGNIGWKYEEQFNFVGEPIASDLWVDTAMWIPIPNAYTEALVMYVVYKLLSSIDMGEENSEAYVYMRKYEEECARLQLANPVHVQDTQRDISTGWV